MDSEIAHMENEKALREQHDAMLLEIRWLDEKLLRNGITDRNPSLLRFARDMPLKIKIECLREKLHELREKWRSFQCHKDDKLILMSMMMAKEYVEQHEDQLDEKQRSTLSRVKRFVEKLEDGLS